jgi:ribosomal protein L40E
MLCTSKNDTHGPHHLVRVASSAGVIVVVSLIAFLYCVGIIHLYESRFQPWFENESSAGYESDSPIVWFFIYLVWQVFVILLVVSYVRVVSTDPGVITKEFSAELYNAMSYPSSQIYQGLTYPPVALNVSKDENGLDNVFNELDMNSQGRGLSKKGSVNKRDSSATLLEVDEEEAYGGGGGGGGGGGEDDGEEDGDIEQAQFVGIGRYNNSYAGGAASSNNRGSNNNNSVTVNNSALRHYLSNKINVPEELRVSVCRRCKLLRPPRAHHCIICGSCCLKFDHHCPW